MAENFDQLDPNIEAANALEKQLEELKAEVQGRVDAGNAPNADEAKGINAEFASLKDRIGKLQQKNTGE